MNKEEYARLNKIANRSLVISVSVLLVILGILIYKYRIAGDNNNAPPSPSEKKIYLTQKQFVKGIDQKELDDLTLAQGDYSKAIKKLKEKITKKGNNFYPLMQLGIVYVRQGYIDKGISCLEKAYRENPNDIYNMRVLADAYIVKDPQRAYEFVKENMSSLRDPKDLVLSWAKVCLLMAHKEGDTLKGRKYAEDAYKALISYKKGKKEPFREYLLALYYYLTGNYTKALSKLKNIDYNKIPIETYEVETLESFIYLGLGNTQEVKKHLKSVIERMKGTQPKCWSSFLPRREEILFIYYTFAGKEGLASELERFKGWYKDASKSEVVTGDFEKIISLMENMTKAKEDGRYIDSISLWQKLYDKIKDQKGEFYEKCLLKDGVVSFLYVYIGNIYKEIGETEKATKMYNEAKKWLPLKNFMDKKGEPPWK